jgi:flagellar biosynthesis protein FlhB
VSDKTEEPTPRRLAKAREKGDVAVSAVTSQALGFFVALLVVPQAVKATAARATELLRAVLSGRSSAVGAEALATEVALLVVPILVTVAATSALVTVVQTGALFAPARTAPNLTKLDPIAGLRSLVSGTRIWNVTRALVAALAVGWLAWSALVRHASDLGHAVGRSAAAAALASVASRRIARDAALVGLAFAILDLVVVRRAFLRKLRMSKAEVQREHRESEGDPQLKAARHRAHRDMLAAATINAVKDATVVIVNPEHLATALRYVEGEDEAPRIVATADGELAQRIQEAARAYGIPVVRDVPVARALSELEVGDTIPEALFEAVAEILREIWEAEENAQRDDR